jgi:hypothetical protein
VHLEKSKGIFMPASARLLTVPSIIALALLALPHRSFADSVILESQSGGTYDYDFVASQEVDFISGGAGTTVIELTGLSGVTGATVSGALATGSLSCDLVASYTATTVTVSDEEADPGSCLFYDAGSYGTLQVTSTATTDGTVDFAINDHFATDKDGTVSGPVGAVGATPEPSSLLLLGSGLLGFAGIVGRRHIVARDHAAG